MLQRLAAWDRPKRHAIAALICVLVALAIYWPGLAGPFFSDDVAYLVTNEYIHRLDLANWLAIFDPYGAPGKMTQNYAPVHLLMHGLEYAAFGGWLVGYHVVNVILHASCAGLLALLLLRSGISGWGAMLGAGFFLVHPANVEAVAWVSQLKSNAGLFFALLALLLVRARPALSTLFFVVALLTKALTAFALPVALLFEWTAARPGSPGTPVDSSAHRARRIALASWALAFVIYTAVEFPVFRYTNANVAPLAPDLPGMIRGVVAIAGQYLVMATSSIGVAAFQEAPRADSWLAPYLLVALPLLALLAWRLVVTLMRREEEGVYWCWALISFAPVSQVFPFLHPVADRYLYFILPGLIGGVLLGVRGSRSEIWRREAVQKAAALACTLVLIFFALRAHERATLWGDPRQIDLDAIQRFPEGLVAHLENSRTAARRGDVEAVVGHLNFAVERGVLDFYSYRADPVWNPVRRDPRFQAVLAEMARRWLLLEPLYVNPSQVELRGLAHARILLGDYLEARDLLVRAIETGGLRDDQIRRELVTVKLELERRAGSPAAKNDRE